MRIRQNMQIIYVNGEAYDCVNIRIIQGSHYPDSTVVTFRTPTPLSHDHLHTSHTPTPT